MMNFAASLLFAYLVLFLIQKRDFFLASGESFHPAVCQMLGHLSQFLFLSAFTWMTIMSYEIFKQLKGMTHMFGADKFAKVLSINIKCQILDMEGCPNQLIAIDFL